MTITEKPASEVMRDALESIALAGMSGTGQESEEGMTAWHARRAWEFIGIAARALTAANAVTSECSKVTSEYSEQPQAQGEASEVSETLAQFGKDGTKDWPEWMKAAAHTATASFPTRSKEKREFDIRGMLAEKLTCWHRMSEADSDALVALFVAHPQATEPAGYKLVPVEPSQEMLDAVVTTLDDHLLGPDAEKQYREDWAAMLAAAPEAKQ